METYVTCGICGKREEIGKAKASGWLVVSGYKPDGEMVIRCAEHNTKSAQLLADDRRTLDPNEWLNE